MYFLSLFLFLCHSLFSQTEYLLPNTHPLKPILDQLFRDPAVLDTDQTFAKAGFISSPQQKLSLIRVAHHPLLPGYLLKVYLNSESGHKEGHTNQEWLIERCRGAEKIRKLIQAHRMRHFSVPDKWLYEVTPGNYILVVTRMNILNKKESAHAWKTQVNKRVLNELFILMTNGLGSTCLPVNVPYTKEGKFSFIDTEYSDRDMPLDSVNHFFSKEMQSYWKALKKTSLCYNPS